MEVFSLKRDPCSEIMNLNTLSKQSISKQISFKIKIGLITNFLLLHRLQLVFVSGFLEKVF